MKAAILDGKESISVVDDLPEPAFADDEVVVSMSAVGICGSDLAQYSAGVENFTWP